jgi:hypothetical protein
MRFTAILTVVVTWYGLAVALLPRTRFKGKHRTI